MKERPILFSAPMVRAILDGRKTMTRRIVKPQAAILTPVMAHGFGLPIPESSNPVIQCPYGKPGDRLWVRETFGFVGYAFDENENRVDWIPDRPATPIHELKFGSAYFDGYVIYAADGGFEWNAGDDATINTCSMWKPSIHMPRAVSRITLEITGVRVERLQDISEADATAEGAALDRGHCYVVSGHEQWAHQTARGCFNSLWNSINGPCAFEQNPWVWVVEFKRLESEAKL